MGRSPVSSAQTSRQCLEEVEELPATEEEAGQVCARGRVVEEQRAVCVPSAEEERRRRLRAVVAVAEASLYTGEAATAGRRCGYRAR
jgi:hypothetical protein